MNQLFRTKSLALLMEEMAGEDRLRRVLGPVQLTSLGVGAIIGAGIFVATGAAAHNVAGPALMLSYVLAGLTCIFAALCYAEFASMVPVAGSAYTYAYATLGELFAWIIGWDLVLEYAVGVGDRGQRLVGLLPKRAGQVRRRPPGRPQRAADYLRHRRRAFRGDRRPRQPARGPHRRDRDARAGQGHSGERQASTPLWSASRWPPSCS